MKEEGVMRRVGEDRWIDGRKAGLNPDKQAAAWSLASEVRDDNVIFESTPGYGQIRRDGVNGWFGLFDIGCYSIRTAWPV